jgi:hypothetical protein
MHVPLASRVKGLADEFRRFGLKMAGNQLVDPALELTSEKKKF